MTFDIVQAGDAQRNLANKSPVDRQHDYWPMVKRRIKKMHFRPVGTYPDDRWATGHKQQDWPNVSYYTRRRVIVRRKKQPRASF